MNGFAATLVLSAFLVVSIPLGTVALSAKAFAHLLASPTTHTQ